ncbi:hypothetical protein [Pseudomonas phage UF_RH7]|nr:hypothetical protein [Pseudomonas phage UF_RH7]
MGKRIVLNPLVVRLANREVKFQLVRGSVPGEYDLERCDSLAGCEVVGRVSFCSGAMEPCYFVKPWGRWKSAPRYIESTLAGILAKSAEKEVKGYDQI